MPGSRASFLVVSQHPGDQPSFRSGWVRPQMNKKALGAAVICIALAFSTQIGCAEPSASKSETVRMGPGLSVGVYLLSEQELRFHQERALDGDIISGYCVAMYFGFIKFNDPDANYWITVAAENGDPMAMLMLSRRLEGRGVLRDDRRARFWQGLAAQHAGAVQDPSKCHVQGHQPDE